MDSVRGFFLSLANAPWALIRSAGEKRRIAHLLEQMRPSMGPGFYRLEPRLAYRMNSSRITTLMNAKGLASGIGILRSVRALILKYLVPPFTKRIPIIQGISRRKFNYLLRTYDGDVKLFSTNYNLVEHHIANPEKVATLLKAQKTLGLYLPVTALTATEDKRVLREPLYSGEPLHNLNLREQVRVYRTLLGCFVKLTREHLGESVPPERAAELVGTGLRALHRICSRQIREDELIRFISAVGLVPSHGDLHSSNIIVCSSGPIIIDLDSFGNRPFFYDAFSIPFLNAHRYSDLRLLRLVGEGEFDEAFADLFAAAGLGDFRHTKTIALLCYCSIELSRWLPVTRSRIMQGKIIEEWSSFL